MVSGICSYHHGLRPSPEDDGTGAGLSNLEYAFLPRRNGKFYWPLEASLLVAGHRQYGSADMRYGRREQKQTWLTSLMNAESRPLSNRPTLYRSHRMPRISRPASRRDEISTSKRWPEMVFVGSGDPLLHRLLSVMVHYGDVTLLCISSIPDPRATRHYRIKDRRSSRYSIR